MREILLPISHTRRVFVCQDIAPGAGGILEQTVFRDGEETIVAGGLEKELHVLRDGEIVLDPVSQKLAENTRVVFREHVAIIYPNA